MNDASKKIGILGGGSWGTVLSEIASSNGHEILIWSRNKKTVFEINNKHTNKKYTGAKKLSNKIKATSNQRDVLKLGHIIIKEFFQKK
jgi:glycerol-3-phosphate dehydrogenase (NAD(P)+)